MYKHTKRRRRVRKNRRTRYRKRRGGASITYTTDGGENKALESQLVSSYQTNQMNKIINS